jgi:hypothetical protein
MSRQECEAGKCQQVRRNTSGAPLDLARPGFGELAAKQGWRYPPAAPPLTREPSPRGETGRGNWGRSSSIFDSEACPPWRSHTWVAHIGKLHSNWVGAQINVVFFSLFHFSHLPFRPKDGESIFFLLVFHIFANGRRIEATHRAQGVVENWAIEWYYATIQVTALQQLMHTSAHRPRHTYTHTHAHTHSNTHTFFRVAFRMNKALNPKTP